MSAEQKKSTSGTLILILLGLAALFAGANWLVLLVPAALIVWFGAGSAFRTGRN